MDFRILGRLEAREGERDLAPGRAKTRAVLALLLLRANQRLAADRMIEELWGELPPSTADKALQGHVSTLRKLLGAERITTDRGGYRIQVGPDELDAQRFELALAEARAAAAPDDRLRLLNDALAIWRGEPLEDLSDERFAGPDIARLNGLRQAAVEERIRVMLELGRHADVLPDLERLVRDQPLSEGLRAGLMLAMYRSGRQADALRVYREGRRRLVEELGIEPGEELQRLERQVLDQDPALAPPVASPPLPPRRQERRTITVLVAEVEATNPLELEDRERLVGPVVGRIRDAIERAGGTAEPLFANAQVGIFGAPRAHDDDPLRAVRAGLELLDEPPADGLMIRGGIEMGEALVTIEGPKVEVSGEVVQAAARLQARAALGSFAVGPRARAATADRVEYEAVVDGVAAAVSLRPFGSAAPEPPFVGREQELALLERVYRRARDDRSVQLVTVAGEPGAGKSRLVRELRALVDGAGQPPAWRRGQCLPYGREITFWALGEIVAEQAGILQTDDASTVEEKLAAAVAGVEADEVRRAWLQRSVGALVGLEDPGVAGGREQVFAGWRQFLESIAARGPLVLVFEDIQWADEALLAFIDDLAASIRGVPLLVVCTTRLELFDHHPGWGGGKRNATTIALEPLTHAETERLLRTLLGREPDAAAIARAGGNPLFAVELARADGAPAPEPDADMPDTIQSVITARLDTLPPELRTIASDAAVIGEVFWSGAVAAVAGAEEREIEERLRRLVAADVARVHRTSSVAGQGEFAFLHVLVRDIAYGQIPRRDRIARHRAAARWIEELAADRPANHAELVAHHELQALELATQLGDASQLPELRARALRFLTLAGERARALDMARAGSLYQRALDLTEPDDPARGRLLAALAEVAQHLHRLEESATLGRTAVDALRRHGDVVGAGGAMVDLSVVLWRLARSPAERRRLVREAIALLETAPPGRELVRAYTRMANGSISEGRAAACRRWSRKALALARRVGTPEVTVQPLHHLGIARFELGDLAGIDDIREALRIGMETGLGWETATAFTDLAVPVFLVDGPAAAIELKLGAAEFAHSRGLRNLEMFARADALWMMVDAGRWDEAMAAADGLLAWDAENGRSRVTTTVQLTRARILLELGRAAEAAPLEPDYLPANRAGEDLQDLPSSLVTAAAIHLALGDAPQAIALIDELERRTRGSDLSRRLQELPLVTRLCVAAGVPELPQAFLAAGGTPAFPRGRLMLASGRATLAEAAGEHVIARTLYSDAAAGWRNHGCPMDEAHALLGLARCDLLLGDAAGAERASRAARRIARRLGARPLLAEIDSLTRRVDRDPAAAAPGMLQPRAIRPISTG